jgi:hypothetical protein
MRNKLSNVFGKSALPALIAGVVLAFGAPAASLAAEHGGGGGHFRGDGGHGFSASPRGGFNGGNVYRGGGAEHYAYRGGDRDYRGGYYRGGTGVYLGLGGGYGYAPGSCGFYDAYGYWHPAPGCYNGVYGY